MKVLLIWPQPETRWLLAIAAFWPNEPLSLEYLAAAVNDFCDVKLLDMRVDNSELEETLKEFQPDIVAVTGITSESNECKRILSKAKAFDSRILTVAGGHHATVATQNFLYKDIDLVIVGEGAIAFREVVEAFQQGRDFRHIKGIGIRDGDTLHMTDPRPYTELNDLPFPDRSTTSHQRHKYFHWLSRKPMAMMQTTVGCPFKCEFCSVWKLPGRYMTRDPKMLVQELSTIEEDHVHFTDDEFLCNKDWVLRFAEAIKESGIEKRYHSEARADFIVRSPEAIEKWREIGLSQLLVGLETFRDEELKDYRKQTSISMNDEAIRILKDNDVAVLGGFLVRADWEKKDFEALKNYVREREVVPSYSVLIPLPGNALPQDDVFEHNYDLWDMHHVLTPTKLELKEFYTEFANLMDFGDPAIHNMDMYMEALQELPPDEQMRALQAWQQMAQCTSELYDDHFPSL